MAETKLKSFGSLFPNGIDIGNRSVNGSGNRETYLHVTDVLNIDLIVEKFIFDNSNPKGEALLIYSDRGIIKTFGGVLIKQAQAIQKEIGNDKIQLKIISHKSKTDYTKTYYSFA